MMAKAKYRYEVITGIYELSEVDDIVGMPVTTVLHTSSSKEEAERVEKAVVAMFNKAKGTLES